jgi:uncharacterized protein YqgV (UPF0045/DUF77 family)
MANVGRVKITIDFPDHEKNFGPMEICVNAEWDEAAVRKAAEYIPKAVAHEIQTRIQYQGKIGHEELMRKIGDRTE